MIYDGISPIIKDLKDLKKQPARFAIDIKVLKDLRLFGSQGLSMSGQGCPSYQ